MQFSVVLKNLRTDRNLTQEQLARELNISKSTVSMYERSERMPDADMLARIARFFNVSVDYLINNVTYNIVIDRVEVLLQKRNKTLNELCNFLKIAPDEYTRWKLNISKAYMNYLSPLAEFFEVHMDYIAGRSDILSASFSQQAADTFGTLSEEEIQIVLSYRKSSADTSAAVRAILGITQKTPSANIAEDVKEEAANFTAPSRQTISTK